VFASSTDKKWVPLSMDFISGKKEEVVGSKIRQITGVSTESDVFTG
jgi:hypothetical protein